MKTFGVAKKSYPSRPQTRRLTAASLANSDWHIGKAAVRQLLRGPTLQAKLTVGAPNEIYEQEADRVADAVMCMPEPQIQAAPT